MNYIASIRESGEGEGDDDREDLDDEISHASGLKTILGGKRQLLVKKSGRNIETVKSYSL